MNIKLKLIITLMILMFSSVSIWQVVVWGEKNTERIEEYDGIKETGNEETNNAEEVDIKENGTEGTEIKENGNKEIETEEAGIEETKDSKNTELEEYAGNEQENEEQEIDESEYEEPELIYSRGRVLRVMDEVEKETEYSGGAIESNIQLLEVLIIKGPHKGEKVEVEFELNFGMGGEYKASPLSEGKEVLLYIEENDEGELDKAYVAEIARDKYLLYLVIGFVLLLLIVGRLKGLKAIISLALTIFAIIRILLPAILAGWDPVIVSVLICIGVISITMIIISGFNKKTLAAVIGTAGGVIAAGIIALIIGSLAMLTGFGDDESQMLMYIPQEIKFDFRGLLFAGILIGTMGATMDVGMSIASAMHEIKVNSPKITTSGLIKAGMNVGRDMMATMANTLILAYTGSSLHLMLLLMAHKTPFSFIINWDMIASEVLRAVAGSVGIIIAIPITAFASALIEDYKNKSNQNHNIDYR